MLPIGNSYPPGVENPITLRADAALAAAGAWDAAPTEIAVIGFDQITLFLSYDEAAAVAGNGAVDWYLEYSPYAADVVGVDSWFQMSLYAAGVMAAGADIQSRLQREYITYDSTAAASEAFVYGPIDLKQTIERLRLVARESGDVANPGAFHVVAVANSEA